MRANEPQSTRKKHDSVLLGLAFDAKDGQRRITRGKNYVLAGGSEETHGLMQETAAKINEHLDRTSKRLHDASIDELREICEKVHNR